MVQNALIDSLKALCTSVHYIISNDTPFAIWSKRVHHFITLVNLTPLGSVSCADLIKNDRILVLTILHRDKPILSIT
jgi:hypothetical protein